MNNASSFNVSENSVINNSKNYGKTEVFTNPDFLKTKIDNKHISVCELAKNLNVSESIVVMFSKSLFNEVPGNGFTADQAEAIQFELRCPFVRDKNVFNKTIEDTADKWLRKNL